MDMQNAKFAEVLHLAQTSPTTVTNVEQLKISRSENKSEIYGYADVAFLAPELEKFKVLMHFGLNHHYSPSQDQQEFEFHSIFNESSSENLFIYLTEKEWEEHYQKRPVIEQEDCKGLLLSLVNSNCLMFDNSPYAKKSILEYLSNHKII